MSNKHSLLQSLLLVFLAFSSNHAAAAKNEYPQGQAHSTPIELTFGTFPQALKDPMNKFWLFKFYAPWCGHW
jgi:hypothetical protein